MIEYENISFHYRDQPVLKGISLSIEEGHFLGLIGPNGGGKTTLLKITLGILTGYEGRVTIFDRRPDKLKEKRQAIGYFPQKQNVNWNFPVSVRDVVLMGLTAQTG
ncbi:MAG: ATP-binding cassette domain-containing protein, partial [Spirochaetota bacterium]|nr:ATP-binding cassette domain-containing protein [Spirochaetota bacterium]